MTFNRIRNLTAWALMAVIAAGCARREEADSDDPAASSSTSAAAEVAEAATPAPPPDLSAVHIEVALSPEAETQLKNIGETVSIEVIYGGDQAPGATIEPNELGLVELSRSVHELPGSGSLNFSEDDLDKSRLDQIVGQPQIMVNVVSGKKTTPGNLLACDFYWDTLSAAGRDGVKIACSPNSEPAS